MVKMLKGLAVGATVGTMVGAAVGIAIGVMVTPDLDRRSKKLIKKGRKKLANVAQEACCNVLDCIV